MDDLTKKLRGGSMALVLRDGHPEHGRTMEEAADAIERLERALAPFAMCNPHRPPNWVDPIQWANDVERAYALLARQNEV
jgi:hypothetical protein